MKTKFIAYYDYGMGGVLMFIHARSPAEIVAKFPELRILDLMPSWVTPEYEAKMTGSLTFDIDSPPTGVLEGIVRERTK